MDERIGYCAWCGRLDHHLLAGECPLCREGVYDYPAQDSDPTPDVPVAPVECPRAMLD